MSLVIWQKKSEAKNVNVSREYLDIFSRANEGFEVVEKILKPFQEAMVSQNQ